MRLIWDIPTRLFHWLLVFSITAQWVTAEWLEDAMQWHFYIGYFTLGLIVFRLIWGLLGTRYAKFSQFVSSPVKTAHYAKTLFKPDSNRHAGHNPLGGWMVLIMLALLLMQAISGLFMTDDVFLDAPYYSAVSEDIASLMSRLHHQGFTIIQGLIVLHIAAIAFYALFKKQSLVPAMLHGKKETEEPAIPHSKWLLALAVAIVTAAAVYYLVIIAPPAPEFDAFY